jgi:hypothetical protein
LLHLSEIKTWLQLSETSADRLRDILRQAGDRFRMHDPSTWAAQAKLAHEGAWVELKKYQDELVRGKDA